MPLETLLRTLWRWRWRVLLAALLLWLPLLTLVWSWPRSFLAEAVVAPAETTSMAASALLAPGINVQAGLFDTRPGGNFGVYLAALRSAEAARMLTEQTPVLAELSRQRAEGVAGWLRRVLGLRIEADLDDVRRLLEQRLAVTQGSAALTWTISLPWRDRETAQRMLALLHAHAEAKVRADLAEMARRRIAALEARIAAERDAYLRGAMFDLLAQQQRAALVIAADEAVAARLVSAPLAELRPSLPNRPLLTLLLLLAVPGFCAMAAATWALLRAAPRPALP